MSLFVVIPLILLLLFGFNMVRTIAHACSLPSNLYQPNSLQPSAIRSVVSSWYAPTVVLTIFVVLSGVPFRELSRAHSPVSPTPANPGVAASKLPAVSIPASPDGESDEDDDSNDDGVGIAAKAAKQDKVPDWIHAGNQTNGDVQHVVVSSKLWSTPAEATQELQPIVASLIRSDFQSRHQNVFDAYSHRLLSDESILQSAVKARYLESIHQDFGAFSAPMYKLSMQVEISPVVRTELYPHWKSGAVTNRIFSVGMLFSILTLAANCVALFARFNRTSPHRKMLAVSIVTLSAVGWVIVSQLLLSRLY